MPTGEQLDHGQRSYLHHVKQNSYQLHYCKEFQITGNDQCAQSTHAKIVWIVNGTAAMTVNRVNIIIVTESAEHTSMCSHCLLKSTLKSPPTTIWQSRLSLIINVPPKAQNSEAKWHSAVRRHSVNKRCFVMSARNIRQKMRIVVLFVTNLVQFNLTNKFRLI